MRILKLNKPAGAGFGESRETCPVVQGHGWRRRDWAHCFNRRGIGRLQQELHGMLLHSKEPLMQSHLLGDVGLLAVSELNDLLTESRQNRVFRCCRSSGHWGCRCGGHGCRR